MKRINGLIKGLLIVLIAFAALPVCTVDVFAQGGISVSTDTISMSEGDAKRFTISADHAVASINVYSDDENVARVDLDSIWLDNDSATVTVTAYDVGSCNIVVKVVDGATYDEEEINAVYYINVDVEGKTGPQEVRMPYANINSGEITENTVITLICDTPDAYIEYSLNDGEYQAYTDSFLLSREDANEDGEVIMEIYAHKDGNYIDSEHSIYSYKIVKAIEDWGDLDEETAKEYEDDITRIPEGFWTNGAKDFEYTGKPQTQSDLKVYYHTTLLKEKIDYTLSYKNNIKVSENGAVVTIKGKGNYTGSFSESFSIKAIDLSDTEVEDLTLLYNNGKSITISPKVILNGKTLKKKTDYTLSVEKVSDIGTYDVTLNGVGNYQGTVHFSVKVTEKKLISSLKNDSIKTITYDGMEHKPELAFKEVTVDGIKIMPQEGVDYALEYDEDCISAGTHNIVVRALDESLYFAGSKTISYTIKGLPLSGYNKADLFTMFYTGKEVIQNDPRLYKTNKIDGVSLKEYLEPEGNYTISYSNNIKAGTATVIYTGIGAYSGTIKKTFKISKADLTGTVSPIITMDNSYEYVKDGVKPIPKVTYKGVELVNDIDFKLSYKNNKIANDNSNPKKITSVTITGKGNYSGKITKEFTISAKDINDLTLVARDVSAGKRKSSVVIYDSNGKKLSSSDYYVSKICYDQDIVLSNGKQRYKGETASPNDSIPANTVMKIYVRGKYNYSGSRTALYKTYAKTIGNATVKIADQYYTGKEIALSKKDIVVKVGKTVLTSADYDIVSFTNNVNKGKATVIIRGKGVYGGVKNASFNIKNKTMNLTINFDGNGANSGTMSSQVLNTVNSIKSNSFKKSGYIFAGWSLTKDGPVYLENKGLYPYSSSQAGKIITLFAVWE